MSAADAAVIERAVERFDAGDLEGFYALLDADVVLVTIPSSPEAGSYVGLPAFRRFTDAFITAWDSVRFRLDDLTDVGRSSVGRAAWVVRGAASGVETELPFSAVWALRDGRVAWFELYEDHEAAMLAASAQ